MRKIHSIILSLVVSMLAQAKTYQISVLNLLPDDEGHKIIAQEGQKVDPIIFYVDNSVDNYKEIVADLEAAKLIKQKIKIKTKTLPVETVIDVER